MSTDTRIQKQIQVPATGMSYQSGKVYTHSLGLSCCFRQWRASSHCRFLHGYALQIELTFESLLRLDQRNWVVDFGGLKPIKAYLETKFDHTTLVAKDDPLISTFRELEIAGLIQLRVVESTGCEAMARIIYEYVAGWLQEQTQYTDTILNCVVVREHEGNWASYGIA